MNETEFEDKPNNRVAVGCRKRFDVMFLEDRAITLTSQENWVTSLFAYRAKNASFDTTGKLALITSFSFDF